MFGLFKKKKSPEERAQALFAALGGHDDEVAGLVHGITGAPVDRQELRLFLLALAAARLERGGGFTALPQALVACWLLEREAVPGSEPGRDLDLFWERFEVYKMLRADPERSAVQLMWELAEKCGGAGAPIEPGALVAPSRRLEGVIAAIEDEARAALAG